MIGAFIAEMLTIEMLGLVLNAMNVNMASFKA